MVRLGDWGVPASWRPAYELASLEANVARRSQELSTSCPERPVRISLHAGQASRNNLQLMRRTFAPASPRQSFPGMA